MFAWIHRKNPPFVINRALILQHGYLVGCFQAVIAQVRSQGIEVEFFIASLDARDGVAGILPFARLKIDVEVALADEVGENRGVPKIIIDKRPQSIRVVQHSPLAGSAATARMSGSIGLE